MEFSRVVLKDISRGIDARSSQNSIEPGYAEDLLNCDTNSQGTVSKRKGYQGYYGYVPLRAIEVIHNGTDLTFCFDQSINLLNEASTPLIAYGRLASSQSGDFTDTDIARYYSGFEIEARKNLALGTLNLNHNLGSDKLLIGITEATNPANLSNSIFLPNAATYTKAGDDATFTVTGTGEGFVYAADKTTTVGSTYTATFVAGDFTANVLTISAATHNLTNVNVIPQIFEDIGTEYSLLQPERVEILANGDIEIELQAPVDGQLVFSDRGAEYINEIGAAAGVTTTAISTITTGSVFFTAVYLRDPISGNRELVIPESVVFDSTTNELTFTVTPQSTGVIQTVFEPASLIANCITVTDTANISTSYTDSAPQISVWGLSHENLYNDSAAYGGHITHLDSYRRELESRLICGLGGNFFAGRTRAEIGGEYNLPSTSVILSERISASKSIGPFFHNTTETTSITRAVQGDNITNNLVEITQAEFVSAGAMKFYLNITNKSGTLAGLTTNDQITVTNMAFALLNGTHNILSVDDGANTITAEISQITTSDFNEQGACGSLGIFTDTIELQATTPFVTGDVLLSNVFDGLDIPIVTSSSGTTVIFSGATEEVDLPSGLLLRAQRTAAELPVLSITNFVKGDMVAVTGFDRLMRITSIDINNNSLTLDESIEFSQPDGSTFDLTVTGRWIPIEAPATADTLPKSTYIQHFNSNEYEQQDIIRSAMVSNTMYLTNGLDEVYKFDGTNVYRAGLPRVQPHLFASLDTTGSPSIQLPAAITQVNGAQTDSTLTVDSTAGFSVGQTVVINGQLYTVEELVTSTSIRFNTSISVADNDNIHPLRQLQYYFRLNAVDKNQNIITSATVGTNDFIINLTETADVTLKLVGLPTFDAYDYDTIEIKVFRADVDVGEFLEVITLNIGFSDYDGYITVTDTRDFGEDDPGGIGDSTVNNLAPAAGEIINTVDQPLRAKFITTSAGRVVLGNVRDYPELSIQLRKVSGTPIATGDLNGKRLLFRKNSLDSETTTDMENRVAIQFVNTGTQTISAVSDNGGLAEFTSTALSTANAGDWVYLYHTATGADKDLTYSGWYQLQAGSTTTVWTINASYVAGATYPDGVVQATSTTDVPVWLGTDGNYNTTSANLSLSYERLATIRAANALNSVMRVTDTSIHPNFIPYLIARAGDEIGSGNLIIRQPTASAEIIQVLMPTNPTNGEWLVNDNRFSISTAFTATERIFNSRVIVSKAAPYAEVFEAPFGLAADSEDVYDIDPADGQQMTGIITFFATAPFTGAQREDMLVVFKENSIHVVSTNTNQTRRLETQGVGCSFPYTIAYSRDGIIFAHESGIYRLGKDLNITYVGKFVERIWQDSVIKNSLARATATHYSIGRQYKISVPYGSAQIHNNQVLVYDHTRETDDRVEFGAWTRYDNHPTTGWANLENDAFFGTTNGQVFKLRNLGESSDYRDDASAIVQDIVLAALDFGIPGITKIVKDVTMQYQLRHSDITGTTIEASIDLDNIYRDLDAFTITRDTNISGLDSTSTPKVKTIRYEVPRKVLEYLQLRAKNSNIDEDMILAGITINITARSSATLTTAARST